MKKRLFNWLPILIAYLGVLAAVLCGNRLVALGGSTAGKMVMSVAVYVLFCAAPFAMARLQKLPFAALGYRAGRPGRQALTALAVFAVTILLTALLPVLFGMRQEALGVKYRSAGVLIFYTLYDLLAVGPGEEFVFRGYFCAAIERASGSKIAAVVLSALLFGAMHYPNGQSLAHVGMTALMGAFYAVCRYRLKNGTVWALSVAHGLQDAAIGVLSFFLL